LSEDEHDYSQRENVHMFAVVSLSDLHLGRHVGFCAFTRNQCVDIVSGGEAKICKFDLEVSSDENIFHFDISMNNPLLLMHVFEGCKKLLEEEPGSVFSQLPISLD